MMMAGVAGAAGGCSSADDNPPPAEEPDAGEATAKPDAAPVAQCATPSEKREKVEVSCDGVDNDCDGTVDNVANPTPWYRDGDNDGVGVSEAPRFSCNQPVGYVNVSGDCDDAEARVHPGINIKDVCDGLDNDCNPNTLEACPTNCELVKGTGETESRYLFCKDRQQWSRALEICKGEGFQLVKIGDLPENGFIWGEAHKRDSGTSWWLGGTDGTADDKEGKWAWTDGTAFWNGGSKEGNRGTPVDGVYNNWPGNKEPNNDGNEDCLEIVREEDAKTWNDNKCSATQPFVCERY